MQEILSTGTPAIVPVLPVANKTHRSQAGDPPGASQITLYPIVPFVYPNRDIPQEGMNR